MAVSTEVGRIAAQPERASAAFWLWALQRVTAVLLFVLLGAHLWLAHFSLMGVSFEEVSTRMNRPYFIIIDLLLLATVIFHALNGLRAIAIDLGVKAKAQTTMSWALFVLGIVGMFLGANFLLPFIRGKAIF